MRFHKYYFYLLFIISREWARRVSFITFILSSACIFGLYEPQTREDFCHFTPALAPSKRFQPSMAAPHNASGWFSFHSFSCPQWKFLWLFIVFAVALHSFFRLCSRAIFHSFELWHLNDVVSTTLFHVPFSHRCRWLFFVWTLKRSARSFRGTI